MAVTTQSKASLSNGVLPSYKRPPVNEVAIGFVTTSIQQLKIPHIGLLWDRFRKQYPLIEHATPLVAQGIMVVDEVTGFPIPRVWFKDDTETRLIQFQPNAFYFNWRNRKEDSQYPRYEVIAKEFKSNLKLYIDFLAELKVGPLQPLECELTYINHIPKGQGWNSLNDLREVINDFYWTPDKKRFLKNPDKIGWQVRFNLPNDTGYLRVKLNDANRKVDNMPILVLELSARGIGAQKDLISIWDWYEVAHEWIVRGFADVTTLDIQNREWGRDNA